MRDRNGKDKTLHAVVTLITGTKKSIASYVDISEQTKSEEALMKANRKLNLLSSVTRHDIRNQMSILMGYLGVLENSISEPALNAYCQKIAHAAQRISAMIQFTKEYENIGIKVPTWQDCRKLVDKATKQVPLQQVIVKNDLPAGAEIFADPLILKVFINLIDNAVRHGGNITTIHYVLETSDDHWIIICEDDGIGVADNEKERIFERGFGKNSGLGLTISQEILSITGITISETGELGKGARFEMKIPKGAFRFTSITETKQ